MTAPAILVINPNSNVQVTADMSTALNLLRLAGGPEILCETLAEGPFGIESQADIDAVIPPLRDRVAAHAASDAASEAYVIACYSDPGLQDCRAVTDRPVFGIQECGLLIAATRGERFGVIAIKPESIERHLKYMRRLGLDGRLAGERAVNLSVAETGAGEETFERLAAIGGELRDADGADTIVLGCAGMAVHRAPLEQRLGVPVIDPTQAAVTMAIGTVLL